MKILCITPWLPVYPHDKTGKFVLDSIQALIKCGHEVTVLFTTPWKPFKASPKLPHPFSALHCCRYLSIPRNYFRFLSNFFYRLAVTPHIERLAKRYQCQLIHAHTELAGLAAVDAQEKLAIPTLMTLHGIDSDAKLYCSKRHRYSYAHALDNINKIIMVGEPLVEHFKKWTKRQDDFHVINNGFWPEEVQPLSHELLADENNIQFISVSNLQEGKGVELSLNALAQLNKRGFQRWRYTIIGAGPKRKMLENLTGQLNLQEQVFFLGLCSPKQVAQQLAQSDVFVLPSKPEAFGIAHLEAMACGLLTIAVAGEGPAKFIFHEKTGLLMQKKDVFHLEALLQTILSSRSRMRKIAKEGRAYVNKHFTWSHHAESLTKLYAEVLRSWTP